MNLKEEISDVIGYSLLWADCSNCYNRSYCPEEKYEMTSKRGYACANWLISKDLSDDIAEKIIRLIKKNEVI